MNNRRIFFPSNYGPYSILKLLAFKNVIFIEIFVIKKKLIIKAHFMQVNRKIMNFNFRVLMNIKLSFCLIKRLVMMNS